MEENTDYSAFFRAFINENQFSSTNWFSFKTSEKPGLSGGAIAGIVVGVILFIALAALIVFFVVRRRSEEDEESVSEPRKPRRPSLFRGSSHKAITGECIINAYVELYPMYD